MPGRPRRLTSIQFTSLRLSVENLEILYSFQQKRKETVNDIITRILTEYPSLKGDRDFYMEAFDKQSKKVDEYLSTISVLEEKIKKYELTVEKTVVPLGAINRR